MKHALTALFLLFGTLVLSGSAVPSASPAPARVNDAAASLADVAASEDEEEPERVCCKICSTGKACGDSCISRSKQCHKGPGCACEG